MEKVNLTFWPDLRDNLRFGGVYTLDECFEEIRDSCEYYKEDLRYVEFMVYSEDDKPMFDISGCGLYQIKPDYEYLKPRILEIFNKYFPDESINNE